MKKQGLQLHRDDYEHLRMIRSKSSNLSPLTDQYHPTSNERSVSESRIFATFTDGTFSSSLSSIQIQLNDFLRRRCGENIDIEREISVDASVASSPTTSSRSRLHRQRFAKCKRWKDELRNDRDFELSSSSIRLPVSNGFYDFCRCVTQTIVLFIVKLHRRQRKYFNVCPVISKAMIQMDVSSRKSQLRR